MADRVPCPRCFINTVERIEASSSAERIEQICQSCFAAMLAARQKDGDAK